MGGLDYHLDHKGGSCLAYMPDWHRRISMGFSHMPAGHVLCLRSLHGHQPPPAHLPPWAATVHALLLALGIPWAPSPCPPPPERARLPDLARRPNPLESPPYSPGSLHKVLAV